MGFLKKFFSLGSKKSRRKHQARHAELVDASGRIVQPGEQLDGDATRLLRSASAHFSVVSEIDYSLLPPIPRRSTSAMNTPATTPARSTASVQRQGTYTVKVLERKQESCTEFPNANPPLRNNSDDDAQAQESPTCRRVNPRHVPFTPRDQNRLQRLRQDPSVVSLLNMYDDKGRICSTAFSNTPQSSAPINDVGGREQIKRSGSTLRQLLGEAADNDGAEGDISWAERYLGEHAASSSSLTSSNPVETPKDIHFNNNDPSKKPVIQNTTFLSELSQELSATYPIISSMEVEVSGATEADLEIFLPPEPTPAPQEDTEQKTPMRAAEVFGFLPERRRTILERQRSQSERTILSPPVPKKSSDTRLGPAPDVPPPVPPKNSNSPDTSDTSIMTSSAQIHTATVTKMTPMTNPLSRSNSTMNMYSPQVEPAPTPVPLPVTRSHTTGDSHATTSTSSSAPSKIPRGPRPLPIAMASPRNNVNYNHQSATVPNTPKHRSKASTSAREVSSNAHASASQTRIPKHASIPHDPTTPVRTRQQRRVTSHSSSVASNDDDSRTSAPRKSRKAERVLRNKENSPPNLPLRTIFDVRHPNLVNGEPPSPASSSELSPYTKDMMMNLRKQRMRTREGVRHASRSSNRRLS